MKVSYYPGCSLEVTAKPYDTSTQQVCRSLGVELEEVPQWCCCGSSPALKMDGLLSTALSAQNLVHIESQSVDKVVIPCPFCFRRLLSAQEEIEADEDLKTNVQDVIQADIAGQLDIQNLLGFLRYEIGLESIREKVVRPLSGLRLLTYYGCYLVKPSGVTHYDDGEYPVSMDEVLEALGAEVLNWDFKTECCGAGLSLSKTETVVELSGRIMREARFKNADALVVACQLCQANLDMRQEEIGKAESTDMAIPIIYFTQLMGLAFGLPAKQLGLNHHLIDPISLLKHKGLTE